MMLSFTDIKQALGDQADNLLNFKTPKIAKERLQVPRKGFVKEVFGMSNRSAATQKAMQEMFDHGNLGGTGYVSILPVDQGIEHSGGASFAKNPDYLKKGLPYLDGIEFTIITNRSTAILGFISGKFDMTFPTEVSIPLLKDVKTQAPNAVCVVEPNNGTRALGCEP
jgi:ABC-type transport system substrate-binding protein